MNENAKGALEKFTQLANKLLVKLGAEEPQPVKLAASIAKDDGTMIYTTADEFAVGVEVFVEDSEGNAVPAPDGEHKLETGQVAVIADGVLAEIKEAEEEEMSEEKNYVTREEFSEFVKGLKDIFQGQDTALSAITKEREDSAAKIQELSDKLAAAEQKLSETPAAKSVKTEAKKEQRPLITKTELMAMPLKERQNYITQNPQAAKLLTKARG